MNAEHPIPPITDPMGRHWDQPDRSRILVDDNHALMDERTFKELGDYSCTIPTGVYDGKMWKRGEPYGKPERWYLLWYGPSDKLDQCSVNFREIILV